MKIGLVIPWRETPSRIRALQAVQDWYKTNLPNIEIIYSDRPGKFWSASGSRNDGIRRAQEARCDVVIINDADTIPEINTLLETIRDCQKDNFIHLPYDFCKTFTPEQTQPYYDGKQSLESLIGTEHTTALGGVYVCTPESWWGVGGMDEKFIQWGYEDSALEIAHGVIHGRGLVKHRGTIYSLGHVEQIHDAGFNNNSMNNRDIYMRYFTMKSPEEMLAFVKQIY